MRHSNSNAVLVLVLTFSFVFCVYLLAFVGHETLSTHISTMFLAPTAYTSIMGTSNAATRTNPATLDCPTTTASCPTASPTHVTVASLCPRPSHVAAGYTGHEQDWLRVPLPDAAKEKLNSTFIVWDVDIDLQTGEFQMPLIVEWLSEHNYVYQLASEPKTMGWVRGQVEKGEASCTTTYSDGSRTHIEAGISHLQPGSPTSPPYLTCSLQPFKVPVSVEVKISEADGAVVTLPICTETLPRFYAIIQLKAYFSWEIEEVVDWLNYHYLIGFDHVVLHYRWALTSTDREALQPYIDSHFLTIHNWPLRVSPTNEAERYADQDQLILISQMKTRKQAQWILAPDMDEYLYVNAWNSTLIGRRQCNNSLHCPSPIRDFLDVRRQYALLSFWTANFVPFEPPPYAQLPADKYRYDPANAHLPWAVRRIYKRQWHDHRVPVVAKWSAAHSPHTHLALLTRAAHTLRALIGCSVCLVSYCPSSL